MTAPIAGREPQQAEGAGVWDETFELVRLGWEGGGAHKSIGESNS